MSIKKKKKKNKISPFLIIVLVIALIGLVSGIFLRRPSDSKIAVITPPGQEAIGKVFPTSNPDLPSRFTNNKIGYPLYMVEGIVSKIYGTDPLTFDIGVKIGKIFPDRADEEIIKTITATKNTEYVLNDLKTNKDTVDEPTSLKVGNNIVVWTEELNSDIFDISQFTATKIVRFQ